MLCRTLQGHGHWVNILALSTDYVMRTGAYDPRNADIVHKDMSLSGRINIIGVAPIRQIMHMHNNNSNIGSTVAQW